MAPQPARVVFVEDDASIQDFVAMALEDLPLTLHACGTLAEARQALAPGAAPCALLLTDLMLPDGSGIDLLEEIQAGTAGPRPGRIAVFSAGVTGEVRRRLDALDIDAVLPKPVALVDLEACVREAIESAAVAGGAPAAAPSATTESAAIDEFFAGDAALFQRYRDSCVRQFDADLRAGEAAFQAGDLQALRRLAHSLKTVLRMLGRPSLSACAAELEDMTAAGLRDAATHWPALREGLRALRSDTAADRP